MFQQILRRVFSLPRRLGWLLSVLCLFNTSLPGKAQDSQHKSTQSFLKLHADNPHYLEWRGQPTLLVTSGEHYGALLNLDFDYVRYFDELQRHGLNHTRVFSGTYCEDANAFQITDNTLAPKANRFLSPWARSDQSGYHAGGNRFDLTRWDDKYLARLKDLMKAAADRGIVVELTLFCPMYDEANWADCPMQASNNINGIGTCSLNEAFTLLHPELLEVQLAVTRKLVSELREFGNLYYEICNEPYFGGVTVDWQHRIVDEIVAAEKDFPQKHLISMNIANGSQKVDRPHPSVSIFNFHYCVPPDAVGMNQDLNRVIGENETGFRGRDDILYRTEGWDFLLAGGGLYNNLDYSFTPAHPDGSFNDYQSPGGGSVALRQQLGILKSFLDGFDYVHMQPGRALISAVSPNLITNVLAQPGKAYAIYLHVPLGKQPQSQQTTITAKLVIDLPAGTYHTKWLDTKTGEDRLSEQLTHTGGPHEFVSPQFDHDIALSVQLTPVQ